MALERTLSIVKPDAVAKNVIGEIYSRFEKAGLKIVAAKYKQLSRAEAEGFYAVHKERPFFRALVEFRTSGLVSRRRTYWRHTWICVLQDTRRNDHRSSGML